MRIKRGYRGRYGLRASKVIPAWVTATGYVTSSFVDNLSRIYKCILGHTSGDLDDEPGVGAVWATYWKRTNL